MSDAERAIQRLNASAQPALAPLARLLLRTESIASSKVEGLQLGVRELARAESKAESGQKVGPKALKVLANIDAMQLAVHAATHVEAFTVDHTGVLLSVMRTPRGRRCMRQMRQRALRFLVVQSLLIAPFEVAKATTHYRAPLP